MEVDERVYGASWRWPLLISVMVLNICLPSLVLSYGVLWIHLSSLEVPLWLGLAAPSVFILIYGLTQCWFREAADSWGGTIGYRFMASIGLMIIVLGLLICAFIPLYIQPFVYGIFGGLGSSLISAQVDAVLFETYDSRLGLIRGLCFTGQAIGQSIFPHILHVIIKYYEYSFSYIILAGIMLQTLPAIMLLKVDEARKSSYFSRYKELSQTFVVYNNDSMDNNYGTELKLHNLNEKCWKSPSDDNLHRFEEFDYDDVCINNTITPPPSPEEKRRNIFGVEILPEIPEETEESDTDEQSLASNNKKRLSIVIKRLSTIGDNFDECIINQFRKNSQCNSDINEEEHSEVKVIYETIAPITDIQTEKLLNSFRFRCQSAYVNMRRKLYIPSYKIYRIKRRFLYLMYNTNETLLKPLTRSLTCGKFYPALLLIFIKLTLTGVGIALLPMIGLQMRPKMAMLENNFLISLHSFSWICFLLFTPWLMHIPKRNFKYIVLCGLIVTTCACFVLAEASNHDSFSIGCVVAGFGYGAITSCWETTAQDFVGARNWPKVHSTLETVSAVLQALFVVSLTFVLQKENRSGLQFSIFILGIIISICTFIWLVITCVYFYKSKIKSFSFKRKWWF